MSENDTQKLEIFTLVKERCTLANMNIRTEMHGDERQRAVDLQFDFSGANNLLAKLHPDLRAAFYRPDATEDMVTPTHMPHLRFPLMGPISWDLEIPRTRLQLHGERPEDDVVLGDGKTNKFKLQLLDGGTVKWHFRVQFSNPSDKAIAGLSRFLNDTVPVSLECRDMEDEGDNFDQAEKLGQAPMSPARQKAEDLFAGGGEPAGNLFDTAGTDLAFHNDGSQPGDPGHSYTATPGDDPDFREVASGGEQTVTVEEIRDRDNGGVVDATFTPPADDLDQAPVTASNVEPIGKRRSSRKVAGGGLE
jgi:hypothetical protein